LAGAGRHGIGGLVRSIREQNLSAEMSWKERDTSLFFSLLLAGEGVADDLALPRG
jgi:hypothetical protein